MKAHRIEELALKAWPALQQTHYDGWVLRFSEGYTKRANSINVLAPSEIDFATKVGRCEAIYSQKGLPPIFRLNSMTGKPLDAFLQEQNYHAADPTSVLAVKLPPVFQARKGCVELWNDRLEDWLQAFSQLQGDGKTLHPIHEKIVDGIPSQKFLLVLKESQQVVACGLGVLEDGYLGIFDVVTGIAFRKQGFGGQMVSHLLALGKQQEAQYAYLQVVKTNAPALRLYARFGFQEVYDYWYRMPPAL